MKRATFHSRIFGVVHTVVNVSTYLAIPGVSRVTFTVVTSTWHLHHVLVDAGRVRRARCLRPLRRVALIHVLVAICVGPSRQACALVVVSGHIHTGGPILAGVFEAVVAAVINVNAAALL